MVDFLLYITNKTAYVNKPFFLRISG